MTHILQSWIRGLTAASIMASLAQQLTPPGPVKKMTEAVCGVMLMGVLMLPLARFDETMFSYALAEYRQTAAQFTGDLEAEEKQLLRSYIEQESAAYILDEARALGLTDLEVRVTVKWANECWIPAHVRVRGTFDADRRTKLSDLIASELGVGVDEQDWGG